MGHRFQLSPLHRQQPVWHRPCGRLHLQLRKEFINRINDINNLKTGKIVVGGTNYLQSYVLPRVVIRFNSLYPNVEVELVEANSYNLSMMLNNEQIDVVIDSFDENADDFQSYFLESEDIILCVPKDRKINEKANEVSN